MQKNWKSDAFPSIIEELWMYEECAGLYEVVGEVIAKNVDYFLSTERGQKFILTGMATGTLALEFLHHVVETKNKRMGYRYY